jgi:hypothetical protein
MTYFKSGVRYRLIGPDDSILGYFLDGLYYEGERHSGELKEGYLHYYMVNGATGDSVFPDGIGGRLDGLGIVRTGDGVRFRLVEVAAE